MAAGPGELHPVPGLHQVPRVVPAGPAGVPLPRVTRVGSQAVDARTAFQHRRRLRSERVSAESTRQRKRSFITVRNSSCGKVMFSQACVKNSVHRRGVSARHPPQADTPLARHPPWWADTPRQADTLLPWADTSLGQTPPPPADTYCSGRYASYWNAKAKASFFFDLCGCLM